MTNSSARSMAGAIVNKGKEIFERAIRPAIGDSQNGRVIAINVESEDFEIGDNSGEITRRLRQRGPEGQIALIRIGGGTVHRIGRGPKLSRS